MQGGKSKVLQIKKILPPMSGITFHRCHKASCLEPFSNCLFDAINCKNKFVVLIPGFFATNLPRILLDLHEIVVFENALACGKAGFQ